MEKISGVHQKGFYTIYGMFCSYFTKKLETYFLVKGIPYRFVELDAPGFSEVSKNIGVMQIPLVQCPDGTWLCDTTPIIQAFEDEAFGVALRPNDPLAAFLSYFLEDCFDEWLWAPALYYRWAFNMDKHRRSEEFTYTIASNGLPLPRSLLRRVITKRQTGIHLKQNGLVSPAHCHQIEQLYIELLDLLQPILKSRPFLFGDRPCEADIGLHGPMFPHFANDPTPQEIMQVRAPHVFRWVAILWSTRNHELEATPEISDVPEDLIPLISKLASDYVPYLFANRDAYLSGSDVTQYNIDGLDWEVVTAPYRVYCLTQLQERYQKLSGADQTRAKEFLGDRVASMLAEQVICPDEIKNINALNLADRHPEDVVSRLWRQKSPWERWLERARPAKRPNAMPEIKTEGSDWLPIYFKHHRARQ